MPGSKEDVTEGKREKVRLGERPREQDCVQQALQVVCIGSAVPVGSQFFQCPVSTASVASEIMSSSSSENEDCCRQGFGIFGHNFYQPTEQSPQKHTTGGPGASAVSAETQAPTTPGKDRAAPRAPTPVSTVKEPEGRCDGLAFAAEAKPKRQRTQAPSSPLIQLRRPSSLPSDDD